MKPDLQASANAMMILSSIAVVALCVYVAFHPRPARADHGPPVVPSNVTLSVAALPFVGSPSAAIGLLEFSDFECPYCVRFAREQFARLKAELVDPGSVRFYWAQFPVEAIHQTAFRAAEASVCAGEQERSLEMFERLFTKPMRLGPEDLAEHAKAVGLDMNRFKACVDRGRADVVRRQLELGTTAGVEGTPTFFLGTIDPNGMLAATQKIVGASAYEELRNRVQDLLRRHRQGK